MVFIDYLLQSKCSDFKAGDALRSRTRYRALDETAVFGAICPHDFPLKMLSLKHGERCATCSIFVCDVCIHVSNMTL